MPSRFKTLIAAIALIVSVIAVGQRLWGGHHGPRLAGSPVIGEPVQDDSARRAPFQVKGYTLSPVAHFTVRARLISVKNYASGREADLSPMDFALGWNDMSNDAVLSRLRMKHDARFFLYSWENEPPLPLDVITRSSTNVHLIPSSSAVERELSRVPPGATVTLRGWLVDASAPDGWRWRSSRTRTDNGAGACELMWVDEVMVEGV